MEKNLCIHGFFPNSSLALLYSTICMFLFFASGEGSCWGWRGEWAACNDTLFTFLVVIFVTWALFAVCDFFFPFLPSRHHCIGTLVSDSSVNGMLHMPRCCGHGNGNGKHVRWGNNDESLSVTESKPHPPYTNLFNFLIPPHWFFSSFIFNANILT